MMDAQNRSYCCGRWLLYCIAALSGTSVCTAAIGDSGDLVSGQWSSYGGNSDETHYSALSDINTETIARLKLAWWADIPGVVLATSVPLEVDGRVYFATGYSVVRAVDAATGQLLWTYDPGVAQAAGRKLRASWGVRGLTFWQGKLYVGTADGRLIAIDAKGGKPVWSVETTARGDARIINGAPLVFRGKVMIGHTGDYDLLRHYVSTYDAETGKLLWRFFTVPGNPKGGFENSAMTMAAKTWSGAWWKFGGGAGVWNAMTYDPEFNRVYIGTGNGIPIDQKIRSPQGGDNLFVSSIIALNADNGRYVWHYQTNPGDTWDYDAVEDLELAHLEIRGTLHRVLMQASKNGFFYVLDRDTGKLLAADKFAKATWASRIDLNSGRPVETREARFQQGDVTLWPWPHGAHGVEPMAFSPASGLVYIPTTNLPATFSDRGLDLKAWKPKDILPNMDMGINFSVQHPGNTPLNVGVSSLLAWDPSRQQARWRVELPGIWNGGVLATAGGLVFQGRCDGRFVAYDADTGKELWSFDAHVGILGAPITFRVGGRQFVSLMAGFGGVPAAFGPLWDARAEPRRLLTFTIDGAARLPAAVASQKIVPVLDPDFQDNQAAEARGAAAWYDHGCFFCHGISAAAGGQAPDLRASGVILSSDTFRAVVRGGAFLAAGMPGFGEIQDRDLDDLRQYLRSQAAILSRGKVPNVGTLTVH